MRLSHPQLVRAMMALVILAAAQAGTVEAQVVASRNLQLKAHWNEFPSASTNPYSACWSYVHPENGAEYAIIGVATGTAIYNVTDPGNSYRVGFIPGPGPCTWREMKSFGNYIYVVTECRGTNEGIQIISMVNPEAPLLAGTYTGQFVTSHTIAVDPRGYLICNGTRRQIAGGSPNQLESTGMFVLSLANPAAPVVVARWPNLPIPIPQSMYVHDSAPVGDRLYASSIYQGIQRILDFTTPSAPTQIHEWTYTGAFSHNSWPDAARTTLYVTDEVNGEPLKIFDVSNESAPVLAGTWTANADAIVHNAHVLGDTLYLSHYTEGIRLLDVSDPRHPAEFAYGDTYGGPSGGFSGVWEVCPYFPSGTVIASDMQTGLYVYRPVRNYGIAHVEVGVEGVAVRLVETGQTATTGADGIVRFAPDPGTYTIEASKFGFEPASAPVTVALGGVATVNFTLVEKPAANFAGTVRQAGSNVPLEDASVTLLSTPVHGHTQADGSFLLGSVPVDEYTIQVGRPGSIPVVVDGSIAAPQTVQDFWLVPAATWDALETSTAWTVGSPGDNATTGIWTRVEPLGTSNAPAPLSTGDARDGFGRGGLRPEHEGHESDGVQGQVQPETDRTPPPGQMCFVTGQGTNPGDVAQQDIDNGRTTLTSPRLDLSGMSEPTIGFWYWFYGGQPTTDLLAISISNNDGASWVPVDTIYGIHTHWQEWILDVNDFLPATSQMRVRFEAADFGTGSIVEAAIDDLVTYDANTPVVGGPSAHPATLAWRAPTPNPSRAAVALALELPRAGDVHAAIIDARGARVRTVFGGRAEAGRLPLAWDGRDEGGRMSPAGLYFAVARFEGRSVVQRLVRLP